MNYRLEVSATFKRNIKNLGKRYASITDDYARLLDELEKDPGLGADLGGGLRKIRMAITSKGHGKRGGARVITFTVIVSVEETSLNGNPSNVPRYWPFWRRTVSGSANIILYG